MVKVNYHSNLKWVWFVGPCVLVLLAFVIFPLIYSLSVSFTDYSLTKPIRGFVGFTNYLDIFRLKEAQQVLGNTATIVLGAVTTELIMGLIIAFLFNRRFRLRGLAIMFFAIPALLAPTAVGAIWKLLLQPNGILNYLYVSLGGKTIDWFGNPRLALVSIMIADIWQWTPFVTLLLLAGLSAIPTELYESAQVDGANAFQNFIYITLPSLKTSLVVALLFRTIDVIRFMDTVWIMTRGGPGISTETVAVYIYLEGFRFFKIGYASAASWIVLIIISILVTILLNFLKEEK